MLPLSFLPLVTLSIFLKFLILDATKWAPQSFLLCQSLSFNVPSFLSILCIFPEPLPSFGPGVYFLSRLLSLVPCLSLLLSLIAGAPPHLWRSKSFFFPGSLRIFFSVLERWPSTFLPHDVPFACNYHTRMRFDAVDVLSCKLDIVYQSIYLLASSLQMILEIFIVHPLLLPWYCNNDFIVLLRYINNKIVCFIIHNWQCRLYITKYWKNNHFCLLLPCQTIYFEDKSLSYYITYMSLHILLHIFMGDGQRIFGQ